MSNHNTRTWSFDETKSKEDKILTPPKSKSFNFRDENPPGTIIPNNKKNKKKNNFNTSLNYEELITLKELAKNKEELFKVIEYFKKIDSNEIEINEVAPTLVIDPREFDGSTIIPKTFKVHSKAVTELQQFCNQYNNHKVQDIVSFLILDGIKRYSK